MPQKRSAHITDHALLRYMERVLGVDTDAIRAKMLADGRDTTIARIDHGKLRSPELGVRLIVRNGCVVSVTCIDRPAR